MNVREYRTASNSGDFDLNVASSAGGGRPRLTVVYTTIEGTLAALDAAISLSEGLNAHIAILVAEEVGSCYPLDRAPIASNYFEKVCRAMFRALDIPEATVDLEIYFCRRRIQCFEAVLKPASLVVVGEKQRWWPPREGKVEHTLKVLGHDALRVSANASISHSRAMVIQLLTADPELRLI